MNSIILATLVVACGGRSAPSETTPVTPLPDASTPDEPVAVELTPTQAGASLVGSWQSETCGGRTWVRALQLQDDGSWTGLDLVSPCPQGVTCIWSGVVKHSGTWQAAELAGTVKLALSSSEPASAPGGADVPTTLRMMNASIVDNQSCAYAPVGEMPSGAPKAQP